MSESPKKYVRCTKKEASELFNAFPEKARKSIPGHALATIIAALGEDDRAPLEAVLGELFPDEPIEKARRRLTTEVANRVYKDDAGNTPLKIASTRKGVEPALIWIECAQRNDASHLTEAGDRYAAEAFVPAEAVRKTSAEIAVDIISEKLVARDRITDEIRPPEIPREDGLSITSSERLANTDTSLDTNATLNAARGQAIHNATKQSAAVNDSLRGVDNKNFTATDGRLQLGLGGFGESTAEQRGRTVNALDAMLDWANDTSANAPRLLALLGDYGTGKTSHALQFSRVLNGDVESAKRAPQSPTALHIDLAYLRNAQGLAQLNVTQIIDIVIGARGLKGTLSASVVVSEVRDGRRIVVYDGLDELMQTDHAQLHSVYRQLLQIFEPDPVTRIPSRARAIVSCRTHYFRDLSEQHQFFNTRSRGGVSSKDYLCLYLLPWTQETIREYLAKRLNANEAKALEDTIRTTYNLEELASRPVLLAMMCEQVNEILRLRDANGGAITASTLYAQTVAMWVHRDNEKHILQPTHKPVLMGALACAMWNDGKEQWDADQLDRWLRRAVDLLFPGHYSPEQTRAIQDDLRTATFIVRQSTSGDGFAFAHRSFQEFFLARHVVTILDQTDLAELTLRTERLLLPDRSLNRESLDFLFELHHSHTERWIARASRIWCWLSYERDIESAEGDGETPAPAPACHAILFRIAVDLRLDAPEDCHRANLRFSMLKEVVVEGIRLPPLDLRRAQLTSARFVRCESSSIWAQFSDAQSATFRDCSIGMINIAHAKSNKLLFRHAQRRPNLLYRFDGPWTKPEPESHLSLRRIESESCRAIYVDEHIAVFLIRMLFVYCWSTVTGAVLWVNRSRMRAPDFDGVWHLDEKRERLVHVLNPRGELECFDVSDGSYSLSISSALGKTYAPRMIPKFEIGRSNRQGGAQAVPSFMFSEGRFSGCTRYFVHGDQPSTACFDAEGRLVDYDEEAADTWLRYLGNGYPQPVEAAWLELDEFGRVLGPKKEKVSGE
jgi:hypothetical protein